MTTITTTLTGETIGTLTRDPTTGKYIIRLNASALKESSCMLRLWRTVAEGYRSPTTNNVLDYGSAFHKFREVLALKGDYHAAMFEGVQYFLKRKASGNMYVSSKKDHLDEFHLQAVCTRYYNEFNGKDTFERLKNLDDKPLVEQKFAVPYYSDDFCDVILVGTIDMIGYINKGCHAIGDIKTTSVYEPKSYLEGYRLSPQLRFYRFILAWLGKNGPPNNVFAKFFEQRVGSFIDGVFLKPDASKVEFHRSEMFFFGEDDMDEFKRLLDTKIGDLLHYLKVTTELMPIKSKHIPLKEGKLNGACQTIYGKCRFAAACGAPDAVAEEFILKNQFKQTTYDPLNYDGVEE